MHQPICACENPLCPGNGGRFYVTVVDGKKHGFLLGPYEDHQEALNNVERGRTLADKADPRAHWYSFGTARIKDGWPLPERTVFGR